MALQHLVMRSSDRSPDALAIKGIDGEYTYLELNRLANRIAHALAQLGVKKGDRVGVWLDKSVQAVATLQAVLRLGAAYVPLDPLSPVARVRTIVEDCQIKALVSTQQRAAKVLTDHLQQIPCLCTDGNWEELVSLAPDRPIDTVCADQDLAYILYTSGSTGKPKGVCISHRNALAFINWAVEELQAKASDRFSNHAPFHFDLSVLDLYAAFSVGASVFLIPDGMSYSPQRLVHFLSQENITIWYSVPSVLILMMEQGGLLTQKNLNLRAILFAGEPFAIKHLRRLYQSLTGIRYLNLYGPTETNVCTFYEVQDIEPDRIQPVPIGRACSEDFVWAQKTDGTPAHPNEEGELMVAGATVMLGYWGRSPQENKPYATGDIVRLSVDGNYIYVGRHDHLVKVRGHRIELGEIEAALEQHPDIQAAAVVISNSGLEAHLVAFLASSQDLPLLSIKRHCAERLPPYMIVDKVCVLPELPRTRNGKIDRLALAEQAAQKTQVLHHHPQNEYAKI